MFSLRKRVLLSAALLFCLVIFSSVGYYLIGGGKWNFIDCLYFTVYTLATVGFTELFDFSEMPWARIYTIIVIVSGMGLMMFFVTSITAFIVEGELRDIWGKWKMKKMIENMKGHIIVCGVGQSGRHIVEELVVSQWKVVVIDISEERINWVTEHYNAQGIDIAAFPGNASEDECLLKAGIERAYGIVAALPEDKDNLFITLTARGLNPKLRIVAKAIDPSAVEKMKKAGADAVVSINYIGGLRMSSEMIRPHVVSFLDVMLRAREKTLRMEEIILKPGSELVGKALKDARLREKANLLVVAIREPVKGKYIYAPPPDVKLEEGMTLIVLGETSSVQRVRQDM